MPCIDCRSTSLVNDGRFWAFATVKTTKKIKRFDDCDVKKSHMLPTQPAVTRLSPDSALDSLDEWQRGEYVHSNPPSPWYIPYMVVISGLVVTVLGALADWLRIHGYLKVHAARDHEKQTHFPALKTDFEALYINNFYRMSSDILNRPVAGVPGTIVRLRDRISHDYGWSFEYTGGISEVINMGSYNYLGFAENTGPCADEAVKYIDRYGLASCSPRTEYGSRRVQRELEQDMARYLEVEDAICFPMGFATNSMNITALVGKGSLILSDELNHASLVLGCRLTGATIKVFRHNGAIHRVQRVHLADMADLKRRLREGIVSGQPVTHRPYKKILIVVEGIYSMEGTIVNLPELIALKKKYKAYLFVDEAHSIGALGPRGKGVVDYWGCKATDVDILMGTLTKSFAGAGGYIAGTHALINYIRAFSQGCYYGTSMSPPVIAQIATSIKIMTGEDGTDEGRRRTRQLSLNTRYFRRRLNEMGFLVYGHEDSPVVPLMTFYFTKVVCFGRESLRRKLGVVSVAAPATPLTKARARFCLSSAHTKQQLDQALEAIDEIGDLLNIKYGTKSQQSVTF